MIESTFSASDVRLSSRKLYLGQNKMEDSYTEKQLSNSSIPSFFLSLLKNFKTVQLVGVTERRIGSICVKAKQENQTINGR